MWIAFRHDEDSPVGKLNDEQRVVANIAGAACRHDPLNRALWNVPLAHDAETGQDIGRNAA